MFASRITFLSILVAAAQVACGAEHTLADQADVQQQDAALGTYARVWTCDGAVVDVDTDERRFSQLVINSYDALSYLNGQQVVSLGFNQNELVIRGDTRWYTDFNASTGPKLRYNDNVGGVFNPSDFDHFIDNGTYVVNSTRVGNLSTTYRKGSDITIQYANIDARGCAGSLESSPTCDNPYSDECPKYCNGDDYTGFTVRAEYTFHHCH